MSLLDYLKTQFLEIIQWEDDSRDTLSYRYPVDKEIKRGAQLIVRESQLAQFLYLGEFGDTYRPGTWTLTTDNTPILNSLKGWKYGFESPFKADVYFLNTRLFTGNKWGTANPIMMRDADFGLVRVRAFGTFDFHIVDPKLFLKEVAWPAARPNWARVWPWGNSWLKPWPRAHQRRRPCLLARRHPRPSGSHLRTRCPNCSAPPRRPKSWA